MWPAPVVNDMNRSERRKAQQDRKNGGYTVPSGPPAGEKRDERIPYGMGCTWWGTIYQIKTVNLGGHPMPCCPYCGGMLYESPSLAEWNASVLAHARATNDPVYPAFMDWNQNRPCLSLHPSRDGATAFTRLRAQFDAERQEGAN